jgi:hypothetical protein
VTDHSSPQGEEPQESLRFQEAVTPKAPLPRLLAFSWQSKENARRLAKDPQAPEGLLSSLARHPDPVCQKLVAQNPNTPRRVLFELGARHPRQLLQNPVFSLLLLEDPDLLQKLPAKCARGLLAQREVPLLLLEYAARDPMPWMREAAARHPALPEDLRQRILRGFCPKDS